jgi:hypothetical protein
MARFVTVRAGVKSRSVGKALAFDWTAGDAYDLVADEAAQRDVAGADVILATHGFNVTFASGVASLSRLGAALALEPRHRFFGVLWPGDFWLPVVNYPWEAEDAVASGKALADYANRVFAGASSVSFISHSLGARVVLEAVQRLNRPALEVCLTASAVDRDCLARQYLGAARNAGRISVLSSTKDKVLRLAYPAGDFISDLLLGDNDSPWKGALGRKGPPPPVLPPLFGQPIPPAAGFDHGDYLPPGSPALPQQLPRPKWAESADYMRRAVTGQPGAWP